MSKHLKFTRRAALAGLAAAGGLMAVTTPGSAQAFALPERAGDSELTKAALSMFSSQKDVRRVGMACQGRAELCLSKEALVDFEPPGPSGSCSRRLRIGHSVHGPAAEPRPGRFPCRPDGHGGWLGAGRYRGAGFTPWRPMPELTE